TSTPDDEVPTLEPAPFPEGVTVAQSPPQPVEVAPTLEPAATVAKPAEATEVKPAATRGNPPSVPAKSAGAEAPHGSSSAPATRRRRWPIVAVILFLVAAGVTYALTRPALHAEPST